MMLECFAYLTSAFIGLIVILFLKFKQSKNLKPLKNSILIVFGSGGHTGEMLCLIKKINFKEYKKVYFVKALSDNVSKDKVEDFIKKQKMEIDESQIEWIDIPRSRQVKQSFSSSVLTTLHSIIYCFIRILKIKQIDVVLCNGPGLCLPIVVCVVINRVSQIVFIKFLMFLMLYRRSKIIFVESWCRVQKLSLSGKILIHIVDRFLVQWEELAKKHPNVEYIGQLI